MKRRAFCNPVYSSTSNISDSVSPTTLLNMLQIETPKFAIKIRGEVLAIRPWPNANNPIYLYGEIGDSSSCIEFKIQPNTKLKMRGQHIEILGALQTSLNDNNNGIKISIEGEMVNEYKVEMLPSQLLHHDYNKNRLSLKRFLDQYKLNQLCILSTRHGFADFIAKTNQSVLHHDVMFSVCNFDSIDNIITGIQEAVSNGDIKALAIIHDGVNCWDTRKWDSTEIVCELLDTKLHFYTALCETDNLLLADKHADENFITPKDFATQMTSILIENRQRDALIDKVYQIESKFETIYASKFKLKKVAVILTMTNILLVTLLIVIYKLNFI